MQKPLVAHLHYTRSDPCSACHESSQEMGLAIETTTFIVKARVVYTFLFSGHLDNKEFFLNPK